MTITEPTAKIVERHSNDVVISCFGAFSCSLVSLSLELVLARLALTNLGSTALASTLTITIYLCGLALGALIAQNLKAKTRAIQLAATALVLAPVFCLVLMQLLAQTTLASPVIWLLLTLALIIPSTSSAALVSLLATRQQVSSNNYIYLAANLGAFSGTLLTGFVILPQLGLSGSLLTLIAIMIPATIFSWFSRIENNQQTIETTATFELSKSSYQILFGSAMLLTVLECDWLRFSALLFGSSSQTFAGTLTAIIAGLALGNFVALKLNKEKKDSFVLPAAALTLSTLAVLLSLKSLAILPTIFQYLRIYFERYQSISEIFLALPQQLATALLVVPTSICLGLIFPLYTNSLSALQWRKAYTISSAGAIIGPTVFMLILPFTSLELVLKICTVLLVISTLLEVRIVCSRTKTKRPLVVAFLAGSTFVIFTTLASADLNKQALIAGLAYLPASEATLKQTKGEAKNLDLEFYKDGLNNTISVERSRSAYLRILKSDGKVEATIPIEKAKPASGSDLGTQTMLCLLPAMVHGGDNLSCLTIGLGSGTTSDTASHLNQIKAVDVVELEPFMLLAADCFGTIDIKNKAPKAKFIFTDARAHLRENRTYDLIISQPSEPWIAGSSSLFTVELFRLMRQRLKNDGIAAQWLQLYGLNKSDFICALSTFAEVFPNTLIFHQKGAGEIILIGANDPKTLEQLKSSEYKTRFLSQALRKKTALAGLDSWNTFAQSHLAIVDKMNPLSKILPNQAMVTKFNTDDNLRLEYGTGRYLANKEGAVEKQLQANLDILENSWRLCPPDCEPNDEVKLDQALKQDSSAYLLLNLKAKNLLIAGEAELALDYLSRSRALNPSIAETRELLALALTYLGKLEEGLQETQAAHLLDHQSCIPYLIAACIYQIKDNGTEAHLNLEKARQKCPENEILKQIAGLKINTTGILKSILMRL